MAPSLTPPENEPLRIFAADPKKPESGREKLVPGIRAVLKPSRPNLTPETPDARSAPAATSGESRADTGFLLLG
jgi:hypothetical protein